MEHALLVQNRGVAHHKGLMKMLTETHAEATWVVTARLQELKPAGEQSPVYKCQYVGSFLHTEIHGHNKPSKNL